MKKEKKGGFSRYTDEKLMKYLLLIESMLADGMDDKAKESASEQYNQIMEELKKRGLKKYLS